MTNTRLSSFPAGSVAVVVGAGGGIGAAVAAAIEASGAFSEVIRLSRSTEPPVDFDRPETVEAAAAHAAARAEAAGGEIRLVVDATGFLHGDGFQPEKSWRDLDAEHLAQAFRINAIGPALLMRAFLERLPRRGRAVFATLSAKVGSIGDNRFGGWYAYRASKAALNQLVKTAAIEGGRRRKDAIVVALHPGTVDTGLSAPFSKEGLTVRDPATAAADLLRVIDRLGEGDSGRFWSWDGSELPW